MLLHQYIGVFGVIAALKTALLWLDIYFGDYRCLATHSHLVAAMLLALVFGFALQLTGLNIQGALLSSMILADGGAMAKSCSCR